VSAQIDTICSSNKIEFRERLNKRIDLYLQDNELILEPYDTG